MGSKTSATFGPRLKLIREHRRLTQCALAAAIRKSKQTISVLQNSARIEIRLDDVKACARILRCSKEDLLAPITAPLPPCPFWSRIKRRLQRIAAHPQ